MQRAIFAAVTANIGLQLPIKNSLNDTSYYSKPVN